MNSSNSRLNRHIEKVLEAAKARRERIAKLRAQGFTFKEIAGREGVTPQRVVALMKKYQKDNAPAAGEGSA